MMTSKLKTQSSVRVAAVAGVALAVAGVAGAVFMRTMERKQTKLSQELAREDAEAKARMDAEGGSMQAVAVS